MIENALTNFSLSKLSLQRNSDVFLLDFYRTSKATDSNKICVSIYLLNFSASQSSVSVNYLALKVNLIRII